MTDIAENWGPWRQDMTDAERRESILVLRTAASFIVSRDHPLWKALYRACAAGDDAQGARGLALLEAWIELDRLPALRRRQLISSYAGNMLMAGDGHHAPRRGRPAGKARATNAEGVSASAERKGAAA